MSERETDLPPATESAGVEEKPGEATADESLVDQSQPREDEENGEKADTTAETAATGEATTPETAEAAEGEATTPETAEAEPAEEPEPKPEQQAEQDSKESGDQAKSAPESLEGGEASAGDVAPDAVAPPKGSVQVRRRRKQTYASDVKAGQSIEGVFLALRKSLPMDRNGRHFLAVTLADRTGRLEGRLWDDAERIAESFQESAHVRVKGESHSHHGRLQMRLESIEPVDIAELDLPASEFISESNKPVDRMLDEIRTFVEKVKNPHLKTLMNAFLDDPDIGARFRKAPAAQSVHHAWIGGLMEHTLSVMRLCERLCDHYPQVDRDLVLAGAFLHDFGKTEELSYDETLGYTDAGRLVGHLVICCQWIHERAGTIPGFPRAMLDQLVHIVASHHDKIEYGSLQKPQTLEALLVHSADSLDARMSSWSELLESAGPDGWTDFSRIYDRQLFRGSADLSPGGASAKKKKKRRRRRRGEGEPAASSEEKSSARAQSGKAAGEEKGGARRNRADGPGPGGRRGEKRPEGGRRRGAKAEGKEGGRGGRPATGREEASRAPREKKPTLTFNPFAKLKDTALDTKDSGSEEKTPSTSAPASSEPAGGGE